MAEFKKLSEVEQLETASDNATVLVEEGGDIKRVPKKEVGGAGGYVIKLANSYLDDNDMYCFDESYDELYDVLMAGGSVWVDYTDAPQGAAPTSTLATSASGFYAATNRGAPLIPVVMCLLTDVGLGLMDFFAMMNGPEPNIYYPNGSHNLEPEQEEEK